MDLEVTFDRRQVLGRGAFASVFVGKWRNMDVAVKRIQLHDLLTDREEMAMKNLDHPNVNKLLAFEEDCDFKYLSLFLELSSSSNTNISFSCFHLIRYLILELSLGTVEDYCIGKYTGIMPPEPDSLYQMADGLSYIHSRNLVHRDMSTGNVLIAKNEDQVILLKISDFGFCKPASNTGSFSMSEGSKGTKKYVAPEMLKLMDQRSGGEKPRGNASSDIFSMGCLFFTYLTKGLHPFSDGSIHTIPLNIIDNRQYLGSN